MLVRITQFTSVVTLTVFWNYTVWSQKKEMKSFQPYRFILNQMVRFNILETIYVVCIFRRALHVQIYIIFVIWLSCRNGKLRKIWQFSYHEKCVWLWLGLTIRVTHRIYWPKSNVKIIMHVSSNAFFAKFGPN